MEVISSLLFIESPIGLTELREKCYARPGMLFARLATDIEAVVTVIVSALEFFALPSEFFEREREFFA